MKVRSHKFFIALWMFSIFVLAPRAWATNPTTVACPADTWTKVASSIKEIEITIILTRPNLYLYTFRDAGDAAPSDQTDALVLPPGIETTISSPTDIDVYVFPRGAAGKIRIKTIAPILANPITYEGSVIGAGDSQRSAGLHIVSWEIEPIGVTPVSAAKIMMQGSPDNAGADNGAITSPALSVGDTSEQVANGLFYYRLAAVNYSKAAVAAGSVFSSVHVISASKYGAIRIFINAAGTMSTDVPLATQAYDTALEAITAADAVAIPANNIQIGMIVIQNDASLWTANTDDLTDGGDVTVAAFYNTTSSFTEIDEYTLTADDITAQKGTFYLSASLPAPWIRIFLSTLTGEGNFVITDVMQK